MLERHSVLESALLEPGRDGANGLRALTLAEVRGGCLAQVVAFDGEAPRVRSLVEPLLGGVLPEASGEVVAHSTGSVYCTAPRTWWVVTLAPALIATLLRQVPAEAGAVIVLSDARVRLRVSGLGVRRMLATGIPLDLDERVFPVGRFAQTALHHNPVLLECIAPDAFDLYVLRTFGLDTWRWLTDACVPYGYDTSVVSSQTL
jgi:heterotetrameric sarcosine oxidase gamma subunit